MFSYAMLVYVAYNGGRVLYDHRNILSQYTKNIEWVCKQASQTAFVHFVRTILLYTLYCAFALYVYVCIGHICCACPPFRFHYSYSLCTFTGLLHSLHPLVLYTLYIHWCYTLSTSTGVIHSLYPLVLYTLYIHWCYTLSTSTGVTHSLHPLVLHTLYIHYTLYTLCTCR